MTLDIYGRTLCKQVDCPAYFEYMGVNKHVIELCEVDLMYFSKTNTLCKLIKEYEIKKVTNPEK